MLLRFMSVPQAVRDAGSEFVYGAPVTGLSAGVQKLAAFGSSVSLPPMTQWAVMFLRWLLKSYSE